jgi:hypothetical protein
MQHPNILPFCTVLPAQGEVEIYYVPLCNTSLVELNDMLQDGYSSDALKKFLEQKLAFTAPMIAGLRKNVESGSSSCSAAAAAIIAAAVDAAGADAACRPESLIPELVHRHTMSNNSKDSGMVEDDLDDFLSDGLNHKISSPLSGEFNMYIINMQRWTDFIHEHRLLLGTMNMGC